MDYLVPQVYWSLGDRKENPDFSKVVKEWSSNCFGKPVYIGVGAYKTEVFNQIPELIDETRKAGLVGNSFFRYEHISKALNVGERYKYLSLIPPMVWKDSIPPNIPEKVQVSNITDGIFKIVWKQPAIARDGDTPRSYIVYRCASPSIDINNVSHIVKIVNSDDTSFIDTIGLVTSAKYDYAITAVDKGNNESAPASESIIIPEIVTIAKHFDFEFKLGFNYPNPASSFVCIPYEIQQTSPVILKILDERNKEVVNVVDEVQAPGYYIASTDISNLEDGIYNLLLVAGDFTQKRRFEIRN